MLNDTQSATLTELSFFGGTGQTYGIFDNEDAAGLNSPLVTFQGSDTVYFSDLGADTYRLGLTKPPMAGDPTISGGPLFAFGWLNAGSWVGDDENPIAAEAGPLSDVNQWRISFPGNTNFTIVSDVKPVPLPTAIWLLGSALVSLVGVARIQNKRAAGAAA
jgi:hypothetical protein